MGLQRDYTKACDLLNLAVTKDVKGITEFYKLARIAFTRESLANGTLTVDALKDADPIHRAFKAAALIPGITQDELLLTGSFAAYREIDPAYEQFYMPLIHSHMNAAIDRLHAATSSVRTATSSVRTSTGEQNLDPQLIHNAVWGFGVQRAVATGSWKVLPTLDDVCMIVTRFLPKRMTLDDRWLAEVNAEIHAKQGGATAFAACRDVSDVIDANELTDTEAIYDVGRLLQAGDDPQSELVAAGLCDLIAAGLFALAARRGHTGAAIRLANMYFLGKGVSKNNAKVAAILEQASKAGDADAQYIWGTILANGREGMPTNVPRGVSLLQRSVAQKNAAAAIVLAQYHWFGMMGLPRDYKKAHSLFKLAADKGVKGIEECVQVAEIASLVEGLTNKTITALDLNDANPNHVAFKGVLMNPGGQPQHKLLAAGTAAALSNVHPTYKGVFREALHAALADISADKPQKKSMFEPVFDYCCQRIADAGHGVFVLPPSHRPSHQAEVAAAAAAGHGVFVLSPPPDTRPSHQAEVAAAYLRSIANRYS
jgi:hypothetical protein